MLRFLCLIFFCVCSQAFAAESLCDVLKLPNCTSVSKASRRASARSAPSVSTASQFNPANVSQDRGIGAEMFYQPGQSPTVNIVTGTGKMGAGLISAKIENSFFGNEVPEIEDEYLKRRKSGDQYNSHKQGLALGFGILKRKWIGFDVGGLFKYNPDTKKVNSGIGTSLRLGPLSFGYSYYEDDFRLKASSSNINPRTDVRYIDEWGGNNTYTERFHSQSLFAGIKIQNLFLDVGQFWTKYRFYGPGELNTIRLYSAAYIWKRWLFNVAHRVEDSPSQKFVNDKLVDQRIEHNTYGGIQFSLNKFIVLGAHYNYYLLNEFSGSLTVFF